MPEIKCPKCGEVFQVDESGYASIVSQIRNEEFEKEVHAKLEDAKREAEARAKLFESELKNKENAEIMRLKEQLDKITHALDLEKSDKLNQLKLQAMELEKKDREILELKEKEISELKNRLKILEVQSEGKIKDAIRTKEEEITKLESSLELEKKDKALREKTLEEQYAAELKRKDSEIEYFKDLKTRMSTKLVGETLEQHCLIQFNQIRMTAFPNAYFEKDNDARTGSKGDFIYREFSPEGAEIISIMFEMKNENETTATKHKNEDFFKELDKDRKEKGCEYAVLVTMLEPENELYNAGIVDVSYRYEKMYVVRPQCFIPIITLLRNAALNTVKYKNEVIAMRNQDIDITNFQNELLTFQDKFNNNYLNFVKKFDVAIDEIDKVMEHLSKVKDALIISKKHLGHASDKVSDLSIKKLTKGNPTMRDKFKELEDKEKEEEDKED